MQRNKELENQWPAREKKVARDFNKQRKTRKALL